MEQNTAAYIQILLLLIFIIPIVLFFLTEQRLLQTIRPHNRSLNPGKVWLQLIPLFGLIYQFIVIRRIADSIYRELSTENESNWLTIAENTANTRPTYKLGLACAILWCCAFIKIPILQYLVFIPGVVCWIAYWMQLRKYHAILKQKATDL